MTKVYKIAIKGYGKDEFGLQQYEWATEKQFRRIMAQQSDDTRRNDLIMLGAHAFRPSDILNAEAVDLEWALGIPAFKKYVLRQLDIEEREETEKLEGRKCYEELVSQKLKGIKA